MTENESAAPQADNVDIRDQRHSKFTTQQMRTVTGIDILYESTINVLYLGIHVRVHGVDVVWLCIHKHLVARRVQNAFAFFIFTLKKHFLLCRSRSEWPTIALSLSD